MDHIIWPCLPNVAIWANYGHFGRLWPFWPNMAILSEFGQFGQVRIFWPNVASWQIVVILADCG